LVRTREELVRTTDLSRARIEHSQSDGHLALIRVVIEIKFKLPRAAVELTGIPMSWSMRRSHNMRRDVCEQWLALLHGSPRKSAKDTADHDGHAASFERDNRLSCEDNPHERTCFRPRG
jgi:hypothetical protein